MIRTMIASCLLACSGFVSAQMTGGNPEEVKQTAPAPLYRDPVYDGVADPVVVWNKEDRSWWMLYTQRRANVNAGNVAYCYGNDIGIASSRDMAGRWFIVEYSTSIWREERILSGLRRW